MGEKKKKASAYREPLILIAFVILGAIIGMVMGEKASFLYPIGQIWLNLLFVLLVRCFLLNFQFCYCYYQRYKKRWKAVRICAGDLHCNCNHCRKFYVYRIKYLWCRYFRSVRCR